MKKHPLIGQFEKAGLTLKILDKPLGRGRGTEDIVQIDIGRKIQGTRRHEWFEIYLGHKDNRVEVLNIDKDINQLVLFVHEPKRTFEVEEQKFPRSVKGRRTQLKREGVKFRETKTHFIITEKTDGDKRHFLLGVDERQLFIAQLRDGASTVTNARESLGSTVVQFHEGKRRTKRQGEWFFLETDRVQRERIERLIKNNEVWIVNKESIGRHHGGRSGGNPHVADEIIVIPGTPATERFKNGRVRNRGEWPVRSRTVYVRGKIRHVDHKTIKFSQWREVILNSEGATSSGSASGVTWID